MHLPILTPGSAEAFIELWSQWYFDPREELYTSNIGRELTPERIRRLFIWKNGGPLAAQKRASVERNYIGRLEELPQLRGHTTPGEFLGRFDQGGAIWRIFWLHCWKPDRFPIYDQHVHRAMEYICQHRCREIPQSDGMVVRAYIDEYVPFWEGLPQMSDRRVDKALWVFGKFLKAFPCAPHSRA